jgi:YVTN family beta-propeller protein
MPDLPLVGDEFAGYRLLAVLGRGGMSTVFQAENPRLGNVIALKVLAPELASDDIFRTRFLEESRIAASMNHPNVIPIHDMGSSGGLLYIVMRCVSGTDLRQMLKKRGRLQPETAIFLLSQAARALDAAHVKGLVHRDVKPGNLLIERSNDDDDPDHLYLADFGITKKGVTRTGLTSTGQFIGTLDYVAPEQIRGVMVLGMADQYSLGCVLYECLTGRVPFEKDMDAAIIWAHVEEHPTQPTMLRPDLPPEVDEVFARVLAKQPGDRYRSCREFMDAARGALGGLATAPTGSGPRPPRHAPGSYTPTEVGFGATGADYPAEAAAAGYAAAPVAPGYPAEAPDAGYAAPSGYPAELAHEAGGPSGAETQGMFADGQSRAPRDSTIASHRKQPAAAPPRGDGDSGGSGGEPPDGHGPLRGMFRPRRAIAGGRLPPPGEAIGSPARGPARRRLSVLILAVAAAVAVPITLVLIVSARPNAGGGSPAPSAGATRSSVRSVAPSLAVPTVAGKIQVGQTPSYIEIAPNGKFAYVTNPGAGAITVLNTANDLVSGTIKIPQGPPQFVSFSPDSRTAYVSVYGSHSVPLVAFVDTATGTVTSTVAVDNFTPGPSTTSPDGRYLYVPNHNTALSGADENVVDVIDTASKMLIGRIPVPANPHWVAFGKNGRFYTTDHMSATVTVLNAQNNAIITEIEVGETPHSEAVSPDGSRLAVTSFDGNVVYLINTATDKEVAVIPVGKNPLDIAYSPDGRYLFTANNQDSTVTVIDTADNRVIAEIPTGKAPTSISVLPNGRQAYVTDESDGTIEILNIPKSGQ